MKSVLVEYSLNIVSEKEDRMIKSAHTFIPKNAAKTYEEVEDYILTHFTALTEQANLHGVKEEYLYVLGTAVVYDLEERSYKNGKKANSKTIQKEQEKI